MVEKFADYWNKDNVHIDRIIYLPIVDATVRLANLKSGGLDLIERVLATDIKDGARRSQAQARRRAIELGYQGLTINVANGQGQERRSARIRAGAPGARARRSTARRINQVVFNGEFVPGNQWVSPEHPYYQKASRCRSATSPRPRRCSRKPASRRRSASTSWCRTAPRPSGRRGDPVDGGGGRLRPEDPRHRVRDLAQAGRGTATTRPT